MTKKSVLIDEAESILQQVLRRGAAPPAQVRAIRKFFDSRPNPCCLCGTLTHSFGIFEPNPPFAARIGEPPGKRRLIFYSVCNECIGEPDMPSQIERAMLRDLQVQ